MMATEKQTEVDSVHRKKKTEPEDRSVCERNIIKQGKCERRSSCR